MRPTRGSWGAAPKTASETWSSSSEPGFRSTGSGPDGRPSGRLKSLPTASGRNPACSNSSAFSRREDVAIAVATSTESDDAAFTLRSAGLDARFRVIVTGDQVAHGKPAPDIYLEAARRLQMAPAQCVALEDSEAGIVAARRAGMVPLLIPDGVPPSPAAANAAFRVLPSLTEAQPLIRSLIERGAP